MRSPNAGRYYGPAGSLGPSRTYLHVYTREAWERVCHRLGDSPRTVRRFWHDLYPMASRVEVRYSRGLLRRVYIVAWFPVVLPIRGCGNG